MSIPAMVFIAVLVCLTAPAFAAPPDNADPALAPWFQGLSVPGSGISCCSIADCRPTDSRTNGDNYEAMAGGQWIVIPPSKILSRLDNPMGRAVLCWTPERGVICFVRATET